MARISAQDCLLRLPNHFALCILAAARARDLAAGRPPTVHCDNKVAVTALREIAAGTVSFNESVDDAIATHIMDLKALDGTRARSGALPRRGAR
jgi:DNA-directed RNA polymerase subunit omega